MLFLVVLAFLFLLAAYFIGSIVFFSKRVMPQYYTTAQMIDEAKKRFPSSEILQAEDKRISSGAANLEERLNLLRAYFFNSPQFIFSKEAKSHVQWIISHYPDSAFVNWTELAAHFFDRGPELSEAVNSFKEALSTNPNNLAILRNAAMFCSQLDKRFALNCLRKISELCPLDPDPQERMALNSVLSNDTEILQAYEQRFKIHWNHNTFLALERVRVGILKLLFPDFIVKPLLYALAFCKMLPLPYHVYFLSEALSFAILTQNTSAVQRWRPILLNYLEGEESVMYVYWRIAVYHVLAKVALFEKDENALGIYLDKLNEIGFGKDQDPAEREEKLLSQAIQSGFSNVVIEYINNRNDGYIATADLLTKLGLKTT